MRVFFAAILSIAWSAGTASAEERLDGLFASWQQAERAMRSLVVEMEVRSEDLLTRTSEKWSAVLKLIRTPNGELSGSYEFVELKPRHPGLKRRQSYLLCDGVPYLLTHDVKTASRFDTEGDLLGFLQLYFNPIVLLVDRKRAEAEYKMEVAKQDDWYSYIAVKPRDSKKKKPWFRNSFSTMHIALMNKSTDAIPKDMPCLIRFDMSTALSYEIKSWRLNPSDAPKAEEFVRPEDRAGWTVHSWDAIPKK